MSRAELLFERMKQRMKYVYPVYNGYLCETADRWTVRRTAEGLMFQRTKGHYCRMALKMSEIRLPAYMLLAALLHDQQQDVLIQDIPKTIPEEHKIKLMQVLQYYHDLEDTIATSVVMEKLLNDMEDVHYLALILLFAKNLDLLRVRSRKVLSGELEITRKYLVLWARRLHIRYFEKEFREVEFRVTCKDYFQKTDILLQKLYSVNSESTKSLMEDIDGNIFELKFINKLRKSEFYNQLCNKGYTVSAEDYNNPVIYEIPLYNVYLLNSESEPLYMRRKSEEWVKYYLDCLVKKGYLLLGYEDETEQYLSHFILQGKWGVRYRIFICTTEICKRYFYSSKIQEFSEEKWHGKRKSGIIVYDKEKRPHEFDEKLTALDFAFYIHKDIGLCAKQAIINNEMRPLDTILKHGDTVTIISQSDVDNQKYSAEPGWRRFIKTQKAKEYIIRYLEIRFSELEG